MNFLSLFKRNLLFKLKKKFIIDRDNIKSNSLDNLFYEYGSDKANIFKHTQKSGHGYSSYYEKKLEKFKDKKINILELGSYAGASAAAFVKYLPNSKVYCFDVNISNFKYKSKKIDVFGVDVNNKKKIEKILKKIFSEQKIDAFDLIIDDGSHFLSDILNSLKFFFKYLKNNGLYVIEDYMHPNYYEFNNNIQHIFINELLDNLVNKIFIQIFLEKTNKNIN